MDPMKMFNQDNGKKAVKGKKQFQFKLKLNLWTIALGLLVVFFVVPLIITGVQMSGSSSNVDISATPEN